MAAIVVSEINERLSPKNEPHNTAATAYAVEMSVSADIWQANGTMAVTVPTEVPTAIDIMHEAMNKPATIKPPGI